jgi:hypothetical protein
MEDFKLNLAIINYEIELVLYKISIYLIFTYNNFSRLSHWNLIILLF